MEINTTFTPVFYHKTPPGLWTGRNDGTDPAVQRWHQRMSLVNLEKEVIPKLAAGQKGIALIGFACDEGVRRNNGRVGARDAPYHFRKACGNLPVHFSEDTLFIDLGDVICKAKDMEGAQDTLASLVSAVLNLGYQPLVIGGGHEVAYGHYKGIRQYLKEATTSLKETTIGHTAENQTVSPETSAVPADHIGVINFDAHFDLREPGSNGYSSGTGFLQMAKDCHSMGKTFSYLPIGIQRNSNTKQLFDTASALKTNYILSSQFTPSREQQLLQQINEFIAGVSHIYVTICMDVFAASAAPGVSAPAYSGITPDPFFFNCLEAILASGKVISTDIAEYNPVYDQDQRTAKLAAALAFSMVTPLY